MKFSNYKRHHRERVIARKKKIAAEVYGNDYYKEDGYYSKGKIHCSCWMCSSKTKANGPKISEIRFLRRESL